MPMLLTKTKRETRLWKSAKSFGHDHGHDCQILEEKGEK